MPERAAAAALRALPLRAGCRGCCARGSGGGRAIPSSTPACGSSGGSGWMHNRVRMVAASFLVKHLLQPWQDGAAWFWDTLVDADLANNSVSWQWIAGSGLRCRALLPGVQPGRAGREVRPGRALRASLRAGARAAAGRPHPPALGGAGRRCLREAGVALGRDYPRPIVDHAAGRRRALDAFAAMRARRRRRARGVSSAAAAARDDLRARGFRGLRVVGDVHGDAVAFAYAIRGAEAERLFVLQLGDLTDYGPDSPEALRLAFALLDTRQRPLPARQPRPQAAPRPDRGAGADGGGAGPDLGATGRGAGRRGAGAARGGGDRACAGLAQPRRLGLRAWRLAPGACSTARPIRMLGRSKPDPLLSRALFGQVTGRLQADGFPERLHGWVDRIAPGLTVYCGHERRSTRRAALCSPRGGGRQGGVHGHRRGQGRAPVLGGPALVTAGFGWPVFPRCALFGQIAASCRGCPVRTSGRGRGGVGHGSDKFPSSDKSPNFRRVVCSSDWWVVVPLGWGLGGIGCFPPFARFGQNGFRSVRGGRCGPGDCVQGKVRAVY